MQYVRIFVRATCSAFQPELDSQERMLHALRVQKCAIIGSRTSLGTKGYVGDFASHLLGAGVCEPGMAASSYPSSQPCLDSADAERRENWHIHECGEPGIGKSRKKAEQTKQPKEEWNAMQTEGDEHPWAGLDMDGPHPPSQKRRQPRCVFWLALLSEAAARVTRADMFSE